MRKEEIEEIINGLKKKGYTLSMPRIAIVKHLISNRAHHTAEAIYKAILKEYPNISLATVYNTLKILVKEEFITMLSVRGDKKFYDSTPGEHSHFVCRVCGGIKDVSTRPPKIRFVNDDKVEEVHVYLYGVCSKCIARERESKG